MKRISGILLALLLLCALCVPTLAASVPYVTYDGSSTLKYTDAGGNALSGSGDFGTAFQNMLPGVEYSQSIHLKNTSSADTVRFYMSLDVIKTLRNAGLDGAGYTVTLKSTSQTLYSAVNGSISGALVGGSGSSAELGDLNQTLLSTDKNGILVATLAPGKEEVITLSIKADATMSNAYQSATGTLQFQFFAEVDTGTGTTNVYVPGKNVTVSVKTGQSALIYVAAVVLAAAVIVLLATGKKKHAKKQDS